MTRNGDVVASAATGGLGVAEAMKDCVKAQPVEGVQLYMYSMFQRLQMPGTNHLVTI